MGNRGTKRGANVNDSQPSKKTKPNIILKPSTSNANTSRSRSTHSPDTISQTKVKPARKVKNVHHTENERVVSATSTSYLTTLVHSSPPSEPPPNCTKIIVNPSSECPKPAELNDEESEFIRDVGSNSEDERVPDDDEDEEAEDGEIEGADENTEDNTADGSEVVVEDITPGSRSKQARRKIESNKVIIGDFKDKNLAKLAKRCARMATCLVHMCPDDPLFAWPLFMEELQRLGHEGRAEKLLKSLAEINKDFEARDQLVRFMNYGVTAVRLDLGKETRIRTCQFFSIPESLTQNQIISTITWLLTDRKYHHGEVNLETRTTNGQPFRSPLLGMMLRGYLKEGSPKQDRVLIDKLQREKRIPIPFIAMLTVLIGHALQEFSSGYRVENIFSVHNLGSHYRAVMSTLDTLQEKASDYVNLVQTELYTQMMTLGPELVPPQSYDYNALNALALLPKQSTGDSKENEGQTETVETGEPESQSDSHGDRSKHEHNEEQEARQGAEESSNSETE